MPNLEMSNELKAALDAARAAAEVIRGFYQRNVKIEVKADKPTCVPRRPSATF